MTRGGDISEENAMTDFKPMVSASGSLLDIADSGRFQSREPAKQPVGGNNVAELGSVEGTMSEQLRHANGQLAQNEVWFRDLFEEAPIAYVLEGLDSRIMRANRTATRILGVKPEEIAGMDGRSFVPDTPDAQRRLREALDSIQNGTDVRMVLELRRKDDGRPVWVQWWSKPERGGKYTRTMFIDITDPGADGAGKDETRGAERIPAR
jgi:PAS domain S-box-containing protein